MITEKQEGEREKKFKVAQSHRRKIERHQGAKHL